MSRSQRFISFIFFVFVAVIVLHQNNYLPEGMPSANSAKSTHRFAELRDKWGGRDKNTEGSQYLSVVHSKTDGIINVQKAPIQKAERWGDMSAQRYDNNDANGHDDQIEVIEDAANSRLAVQEDRSVIGRPVSISSSVLNKCERASTGSKDPFCEVAFNRVKQMIDEPRDLNWAPRIESLLRKYVDTIESEIGSITIRNLECRKSICVLETASQFGELIYHAYSHPASFDLIDQHRLHGEAPIVGHETDEHYNEVTVTFLVFDLLGPKQGKK